MACFPSASDVPSGETFNASNGFSYTGAWKTKQDSQQRTYLVSTTGEDMATTEFKGLPLSLYQFKIIDASGTSSTPTLPISSPAATTSSPKITVSTSGLGSAPSTSNGGSSGTRTSLSPTFPTLSDPQLQSSVTPSGFLSLNGSSSSLEISSFTEVTTIDGNTATIVVQTTVEGQPGSAQRSHSRSAGPVAGAVVGGVVFLLLLVGAGLWWRRRRSLLRSPNDTSGLEHHSDMTPDITSPATKGIHSLAPPPGVTLPQESVTERRSQENLRPSTGDETSESCSESDRPRQSGQASDPTAPDISSTITERSLVLGGNPSGVAANAGTALAGPHAVVAHASSKPDSESTTADVPLPTLEPEGSVRDATRGEDTSVPRAGVGVRRLLIEQDSGHHQFSGVQFLPISKTRRTANRDHQW
ncbi:hypothetical protein V8D89_000919 [Ganoderma adspersum]